MRYSLLNISAAAKDTPLLKRLWQYFYDTYFNSAQTYENLNMEAGDILSIRLIILGLCIGIAISGFAMVFNKRILGSFVRKLLKDECLSPESAKTLDELGCSDKMFIHWAVKKSTSLRRVVKCREEEQFNTELKQKREEYQQKKAEDKSLPHFKDTEYKIDSSSDRFYIPEEMKYTADIKFDKKGTSWLGAIMLVFIMAIAFVVMTVALPHVLELINDAAGAFDTTPSNRI